MWLLQQPVVFTHARKHVSMLLALPLELRLKIYMFYFMSVTIYLGDPRPAGFFFTERYGPKYDPLAILRTCRQIFREAGSLFLGNVIISTDHPDYSVCHFNRLSLQLRSRIRHVELRLASFIWLLSEIPESSIAYRFNLIPGLRLDTLTICGTKSCYDLVDGFVKFGNGWKELRILVPSLNVDAFKQVVAMAAPDAMETQRPAVTWQSLIEKRDGTDSNASVSLYCTTQPWIRNSVLDLSTRELVSSTNLPDLALKKEIGELLFIVKRGEGATYAVQHHTARAAVQELASQREKSEDPSLKEAIECMREFDPILNTIRAEAAYASRWASWQGASL
ncbi:hypothetical protein GTR04_5592 [Trichophyton interdigitale]|nr:hypothetical protein GY631_7132 [Trichophyton interdigitale]KAG5216982.1 hypothetical protein GY632_7011 [Trichophyton interdigitale]KAG8207023.1 hypothetical protein GTR04_5592 [Trichophyton interdigitale]